MARSAVHPIVRVCKKRNITFDKFAEIIRERCELDKLSPAYISQIARGHRHPSRKLADSISTAFPEISFEELLRFPDWKAPEAPARSRR